MCAKYCSHYNTYSAANSRADGFSRPSAIGYANSRSLPDTHIAALHEPTKWHCLTFSTAFYSKCAADRQPHDTANCPSLAFTIGLSQ